MSLSFNEVRQYVIGLLQNYFPNKKILNKIGEEDGSLTYDGNEIKGGSSPLTEEEMQEIKDQLSSYNPPVYAVADPLTNNDMEEIKQSMAMHCKQPFPVEQHRYSVNEQKVGEWIDGNPIYEKTFHIEFELGNNYFSMNGERLISKNENASEYDCWWTLSNTNINFYVKVKPDNIGDIMIIKDVAFVYLSNGYKSVFSPFNNSSNIVQFQKGFQLAEEPLKPVLFISTPWNSNLYWTDTYVTVRYTKQEV